MSPHEFGAAAGTRARLWRRILEESGRGAEPQPKPGPFPPSSDGTDRRSEEFGRDNERTFVR